ncbi:glutamate [NMDA] receptor subunit 1-like [Glandiceps talaboti]
MWFNYSVLPSYILLTCFLRTEVVDAADRHVNIGFLLSKEDYHGYVNEVLNDLNNHSQLLPSNTKLNATFEVLSWNPIESALSVCKTLVPTQVYAVIVSHSRNLSSTSPASISYTCGFYRIPVIGISTREHVFSDKQPVTCNLAMPPVAATSNLAMPPMAATSNLAMPPMAATSYM